MTKLIGDAVIVKYALRCYGPDPGLVCLWFSEVREVSAEMQVH